MWYDSIKIEAQEVRALLEAFQDESSHWEAKMENSRGTQVMWRPTRGSPIHTLRLDGKLPISMFNILSVIMEVDLYLNWIPTVMGIGLKRINMLSDMDRFRKFVHCDASIPWPIANRDCNLVGFGVDLLDQGRVLAVARSYECAPESPASVNWSLFPETAHLGAQKDDIQIESPNLDSIPFTNPGVAEAVQKLESIPALIPSVKSGIVRSKVHQGGFLLTPISDTETAVSALFQVDPDLAVMPSWLINWCMKHFMFTVLDLLGKAASKVGTEKSPYTKRMTDKPEVYEYLRQRLEENRHLSTEEREKLKEASLALLNAPQPLHPTTEEDSNPQATSSSAPQAETTKDTQPDEEKT